MEQRISPAVVIGAGLIGASVGCALVANGVSVCLRDAVRLHAIVAAGRGAGSLEEPDPAEVRLVVVATPPETVAGVVAEALAEFPEAVVTDVCSVKTKILADLQARHIDLSRYVGGHPMAGSHHSGPLTAAAELFIDRTWVINPRSDHTRSSIDAVRSLASLAGARIVEIDAASHDRAVAEISHVPQLISSLTAASLVDVSPADLKLAGQGVRDMTRLAASDVELWRQIVAYNATPIKDHLIVLRDDLDRLIKGIDDDSRVVDVLARGNDGARAIPNRRGKSSAELVDVMAEIPDSPGSLAKMINDVTATGTNIEDISIEHDPERRVGYLRIAVAFDRADGLRDHMRRLGWGIRA